MCGDGLLQETQEVPEMSWKRFSVWEYISFYLTGNLDNSFSNMGNSQPNKIKAGRGMMDVDKVNVKMIEWNIFKEMFRRNIYINLNM